MNKKELLFFSLTALFCLILILPVTATDDGKIAFVSDRYGKEEIFVMNADGSGQTNLTPNQAVGRSPQWSPDGTRIAFVSNRDGTDRIYVMNADGSEQICLTEDTRGRNPKWSPDGTKIVYTTSLLDLYVMNADGSGKSLVWITGEGCFATEWSPDSTKIAFYSNHKHAIWIIDANGANPTQLTNHDREGSSYNPSWSPDGSKIAYDRSHDAIFSINVDGSGETNLTQNDMINTVPRWSPDGTKIAYKSYILDSPVRIYVMNADGSGQNPLTDLGVGSDFCWSPDADKIVFVSTQSGKSNIYVVNKDGSGQIQLTSEGNNAEPAWSLQLPPNFTYSPEKIRITDNITLMASQSVDINEDRIYWDFGDGQTDSSGNPIVNHSYSEPGSYIINLTVDYPDGDHWIISKHVDITIPVVLVHGFQDDAETCWGPFAYLLEDDGYQVLNYNYGYVSGFIDPSVVAGWLKTEIEWRIRNDLSYNGLKYNGKFDIVCHSMGALVTRWYMEELDGGKNVRQWIGVAPVNHGSAAADFDTFAPEWVHSLISIVNKDSIFFLKTNSPVVKKLDSNIIRGNPLPDVKYRVIMGYNGDHDPQFFMGGIFGGRTWEKRTFSDSGNIYYYLTYLGDGIVANRQSRLDFAGTDYLDGYDHFMTRTPRVINLVKSYIKNAGISSSYNTPADEDSAVHYFGKSDSNLLARNTNRILRFLIEESANKAGISIIWPGSDVNMTLVSPSGQRYEPVTSFDYECIKANQSIFFLINSPEPGEWTAEIEPIDVPPEGEPYTFTTFFNSSLSFILIDTGKSAYHVGEDIPIKVQLKDGNMPILNADVKADITLPDTSIVTIQLNDTGILGDDAAGDGIYTSFFRLTQPGPYSFLVFAGGTDTQYFERSVVLSAFVTNLPEYSILLYPGWNFISIPKHLSDGNNTADIFSTIDTGGKPIFSYTSENGQWNLIENTTPIEPLDAYWIYSTEFGEISLDYSTEPTTPPVKHLYEGWNTIGLGSLYPLNTIQTLTPVQNKWTMILQFDNGLQMYRPPIVSSDTETTLNPGQGYWIYMNEPGDLVAMTG